MVSQIGKTSLSTNYGSIDNPSSLGCKSDRDTTSKVIEYDGRPSAKLLKAISACYKMPMVSLFLLTIILFCLIVGLSKSPHNKSLLAVLSQGGEYNSLRISVTDPMSDSTAKYNESITKRSTSKFIIAKCNMSLLLLRHAKSSWVNSTSIQDFDRPLSARGRSVARTVGRSLKDLNVQLPDIILASPSVRTRETLSLVLNEWVSFGTNRSNSRSTNARVKGMINYDMAWYNLSEEGYLDRLVEILSQRQLNRVLLVGHNPAMELLLNVLLSPSSELVNSSQYSWLHYRPGHWYELCFPTLTHWSDLDQRMKARGEMLLHVPG